MRTSPHFNGYFLVPYTRPPGQVYLDIVEKDMNAKRGIISTLTGLDKARLVQKLEGKFPQIDYAIYHVPDSRDRKVRANIDQKLFSAPQIIYRRTLDSMIAYIEANTPWSFPNKNT